MNTTNEKQPKQKPAFYIFEKNQEGNSVKIGAAFKHKKGNGLNVVIGKKYYSAFPPKAKA